MKEKLKNKSPMFKSCLTAIKDIDDKGVVVFHSSIFNTPDRVKDIVDPGAYSKTIAENFNEIQHYKNHDSTLMPGVLSELTEDSTGLLSKSQLMLKTQLGFLTQTIKSIEDMDIDELVKEEIFYTNLLNCKFTDAKLENLENLKNHISALIDESRRKNAPDPKDAPLTKTDILLILNS
jgi:hypothetical protein